jgi:hypothetical protein
MDLDIAEADYHSEALDPLFAELDQRHIPDGAGGWTTEVIGIHHDRRDTWIQIGTSDAHEDTFLLHLPPWAGTDDALAALCAWSTRDASRRPRVIEVMRHM